MKNHSTKNSSINSSLGELITKWLCLRMPPNSKIFVILGGILKFLVVAREEGLGMRRAGRCILGFTKRAWYWCLNITGFKSSLPLRSWTYDLITLFSILIGEMRKRTPIIKWIIFYDKAWHRVWTKIVGVKKHYHLLVQKFRKIQFIFSFHFPPIYIKIMRVIVYIYTVLAH